MRFSLLFLVYIVVGVLVAAGIIGDERNYFSGMNSLEEVLNMILAVILWPLVLLGVQFHIGISTGDGMRHRTGGGK